MSHIIDGECEIQPEKKREICVHFIEMSLFEGLESKFLQEKYYKDKFGHTYGGLYKCSKD